MTLNKMNKFLSLSQRLSLSLVRATALSEATPRRSTPLTTVIALNCTLSAPLHMDWCILKDKFIPWRVPLCALHPSARLIVRWASIEAIVMVEEAAETFFKVHFQEQNDRSESHQVQQSICNYVVNCIHEWFGYFEIITCTCFLVLRLCDPVHSSCVVEYLRQSLHEVKRFCTDVRRHEKRIHESVHLFAHFGGREFRAVHHLKIVVRCPLIGVRVERQVRSYVVSHRTHQRFREWSNLLIHKDHLPLLMQFEDILHHLIGIRWNFYSAAVDTVSVDQLLDAILGIVHWRVFNKWPVIHLCSEEGFDAFSLDLLVRLDQVRRIEYQLLGIEVTGVKHDESSWCPSEYECAEEVSYQMIFQWFSEKYHLTRVQVHPDDVRCVIRFGQWNAVSAAQRQLHRVEESDQDHREHEERDDAFAEHHQIRWCIVRLCLIEATENGDSVRSDHIQLSDVILFRHRIRLHHECEISCSTANVVSAFSPWLPLNICQATGEKCLINGKVIEHSNTLTTHFPKRSITSMSSLK